MAHADVLQDFWTVHVRARSSEFESDHYLVLTAIPGVFLLSDDDRFGEGVTLPQADAL